MSDAGSSPTRTVASPTPPSARTSTATSARIRSASALPSIIVAAILRTYRTMRWPRKNDPASIRARQELLGVDGLVTSIDLEPFADAAEALTGVAVIPVSVCPVRIELGRYDLCCGGRGRDRPGRGG